jgi:hypothetical protein
MLLERNFKIDIAAFIDDCLGYAQEVHGALAQLGFNLHNSVVGKQDIIGMQQIHAMLRKNPELNDQIEKAILAAVTQPLPENENSSAHSLHMDCLKMAAILKKQPAGEEVLNQSNGNDVLLGHKILGDIFMQKQFPEVAQVPGGAGIFGSREVRLARESVDHRMKESLAPDRH